MARVWAEMWVTVYGRRSLKIEDENGVWYMPFDSEKYRDLLISVKVDVGASALWSEIQSVNTLDNLLASQIITPKQYLERLPKGSVPNLSGQSLIVGRPPDYRHAFDSVPPEQQAAMLQEIGVM